MDTPSTVHVVDDEERFRDSMKWLLQTLSIPCKTYAASSDFLHEAPFDAPGCLILDLRLCAESGIDVYQTLLQTPGFGMPVLFLTGSGDVESAVRGMKLGALDFLEKPVSPPVLIQKIRQALAEDARRRRDVTLRARVRTRMGRLTQREREVVDLLCEGLSSKQIARRLNISVNTVANHRASMLAKVEATNTADLMLLAMSEKFVAAPAIEFEPDLRATA